MSEPTGPERSILDQPKRYSVRETVRGIRIRISWVRSVSNADEVIEGYEIFFPQIDLSQSGKTGVSDQVITIPPNYEPDLIFQWAKATLKEHPEMDVYDLYHEIDEFVSGA